jgi:hypothetical protein
MDEQTKVLIEGFIEESKEILASIEEPLSDLENGEGNPDDFVKVAQRIDGIMGCAKTLGLGSLQHIAPALLVISNMSEGCKALGYRASQIKQPEVTKIVAGFLAEAVEMLESALMDLQKGYVSIDTQHAGTIKDRLIWISSKLKLSPQDQLEIMARFGLK